MAAIFYQYDGNGIFKDGIGGGSLIQVDFLNDLVNDTGNLAIYTDVSVGLNETVQYFLTFDDIIDFVHFGKGLGQVQVNGLIFSNCEYTMPGIDALYEAYFANRGQEVNISLGSFAATGVVMASNLSLMAEPNTMAQFSITMNVIADTGGNNAS